jgi:uncharacterized heparinase superfamily protein
LAGSEGIATHPVPPWCDGGETLLAPASRLFHTLRWLRGRQLLGQPWQRLRRAWERPEIWARRLAVPPEPACRWRPADDFPPPGAQRNRAERLRAGDFSFLNHREALGWPPRWSNPHLPHLWQYNLHYFEYVFALPYEGARELVLDWIERHPPGRGQVGWEPYPTSLRLQNWCTCLFGRHRERTSDDPELRARLWPSVFRQAEWLASHLEFHLLGNHLFENAAALALCGACFEGEAAAAWRRLGLRVLARELEEQVLPDGGHFERSPMYQARVVYVLGLLEASGDAELGRVAEAPLARARRALGAMLHPDGEIALLNDSAFGIANPPAALRPQAPAPGPFALPDTGYFGAYGAEGHYVICDAAPIGPDYLPGHAHGDLFSFELSLAGHRVVTDAGVYGYEADALRQHCRSTRAHNTVEVDGRDQCEFWAAFRVARRGRPRDVRWRPLARGFRLEGWHDGYARLPGRPLHHRAFRWHPEGVLLVRDRVAGRGPVDVRSRLHLHPDCELLELQGSRARVRHPGGELAIAFSGPGELSVEGSLHCPEFGVLHQSRALVYTARGAQVENGFCLAGDAASLRYDLADGAEVDGASYAW